MKKFSMKKIAAVACSAVAVLALGAINASAADIEMKGQKIEISLDELKAANYQVQWGVELTGNPGYSNSGAYVIHDKALKAEYTTQTVGATTRVIPTVTQGPAAEGLTVAATYSEADQKLGWSTMGGFNVATKDGVIVAFNFTVPSDAQPGDIYNMEVSLNQLSTGQSNHYEDQITPEAGYIKIVGAETTTTTTETTTSETTTTTEKTTASIDTTSTTEKTTASSIDTTTTTSSTSKSTTTTTTTTKATTKATTTTAKATTKATTTTAAGTKTGDAGVALAVAGMLAAAGTAIVLRKKED
ncbi:MAG: hypothetical protein MJ062_04185 [Oscillospiraceae bacterium]|nr:hypothetical protein [Oscillospiraceae bacterium]